MKFNQQREEVIRRFVKSFLGFKRGDYIKYRPKNKTKKSWTYAIIKTCIKTWYGWDFLVEKKDGRLAFILEDSYEVKLSIPRRKVKRDG